MWSVVILGPKIFGLWWSVVVCGVQADRSFAVLCGSFAVFSHTASMSMVNSYIIDCFLVRMFSLKTSVKVLFASLVASLDAGSGYGGCVLSYER